MRCSVKTLFLFKAAILSVVGGYVIICVREDTLLMNWMILLSACVMHTAVVPVFQESVCVYVCVCEREREKE